MAALHFYDDAVRIKDLIICDALSLCEMVNLEPEELLDCMPGDWEDDEDRDVSSNFEDGGSYSTHGGITISGGFEWLFPIGKEGI